MTTTWTEKFKLEAGGDVLEITWGGNMYVAPCCGAQYSRASDAMRQELAHYLRACGEDVEDVDSLVLPDHGEWIEE